VTDQVTPALIAIVLGALAGVLLFVPFVAVQYRRRGRLTIGQTALWAGALVYGLALWTYTLLPLPDPEALRCVPAQVRPLQFIEDALKYPVGTVGDLAGNPALRQVALNVLLFVPLGFFLRLAWRRGFVVAGIMGFAVSLAIETTQLTGVWGLYPCAYRLFDVDDLLANTAGAVVGGLLSAALRPWLARSAAAVDVRPRPVTVPRRALGMLCDALAMLLIGGFAGALVAAWREYVLGVSPASAASGPVEAMATFVPFAITGAITLFTGSTLGDLAVLIRWEGSSRWVLLGRALRYLAGIGGWVLLGLVSLDVLFALVSIVVLLFARGRGGLPGVVSRLHPVDARVSRRGPDGRRGGRHDDAAR